MVLLLDREGFSDEYIEKVISNRREYANAHGMFSFSYIYTQNSKSQLRKVGVGGEGAGRGLSNVYI